MSLRERSTVFHMKHRKRQSEMTADARLRINCRAYANVYQRRGILVPQPCEVCGKVNVQKHHDDYTKPLEVRWFCRAHHIGVHDGSTKRAAYGTGNCARCVAERAPGSSYCHLHKREYDRAWRKDRAKEFQELRAAHFRAGAPVAPKVTGQPGAGIAIEATAMTRSVALPVLEPRRSPEPEKMGSGYAG
jgi:hypothetical protein